MNKLKPEKQEAVIRCLVNGNSVPATERIVGVHRDTILRLMVRVGSDCEKLMAQELTGLTLRHIQLDEIHGTVGKKQRRLTEQGGIWSLRRLLSEVETRGGD
ncbi:MAG: hypothetical protein ABII79_09480 [bacterium]